MSMLGPYASWNKETGYAIWDNPTAEHEGIFERINYSPKGIIPMSSVFIIFSLWLSVKPKNVNPPS